jgi:hypothetical protein
MTDDKGGKPQDKPVDDKGGKPLDDKGGYDKK